MAQKANPPKVKNKVHGYKDNENTEVLVYYHWLSFMIPLDKGYQSREGTTIFFHCKYTFSLQI